MVTSLQVSYSNKVLLSEGSDSEVVKMQGNAHNKNINHANRFNGTILAIVILLYYYFDRSFTR
jgi:hypothetical protein